MDIYTIDLETYYDRDFSLSKMTTESYVRDPRFELICVGIKRNDDPVKLVTGTHDEINTFLNDFDFSKSAILCHNAAFDGAILSWHFGIRPKLWIDTLSMSRPKHKLTVGGSLKKLADHYQIGVKGTEVIQALGKRRKDFTPAEMKKYMEYCGNDVELTYALFLMLRDGFPASEMKVIDQTIRMYTEPRVVLDRDKLVSHLDNVKTRKEKLLKALGGEKAKPLLMSNPKFAALLTKLGVEPPRKVSPTTGRETYAFAKSDKGLTDLLEHPDPKVSAVVEARLGVKSTLEETRTQALIEAEARGPLPIMLNYYGAHTGRFCLTGDTVITVLRGMDVLDILIPELRTDDLVWDGTEFVAHGGLLDQGEHEVMTYDGITGTPDHRVFCEEVPEAVELRVAAERGYTLKVGGAYPKLTP